MLDGSLRGCIVSVDIGIMRFLLRFMAFGRGFDIWGGEVLGVLEGEV